MRVLVLDDEEYRHKEFARRFAGQDLVAARTAGEAIRALEGPPFNLAQLDHDLGTRNNGDGMCVAEAIAAMPRERRPRFVVVHSFNVPAAQRMVVTLKRAGVPSHHRPFACEPRTAPGAATTADGPATPTPSKPKDEA
jgi:ActR/RegA family two-component response regulator